MKTRRAAVLAPATLHRVTPNTFSTDWPRRSDSTKLLAPSGCLRLVGARWHHASDQTFSSSDMHLSIWKMLKWKNNITISECRRCGTREGALSAHSLTLLTPSLCSLPQSVKWLLAPRPLTWDLLID